MLTKEEIVEKLKANPDWGPDSASPDEVWDLYYEILDSTEFEENESMDEDLEKLEEDNEDSDWDEDDI